MNSTDEQYWWTEFISPLFLNSPEKGLHTCPKPVAILTTDKEQSEMEDDNVVCLHTFGVFIIVLLYPNLIKQKMLTADHNSKMRHLSNTFSYTRKTAFTFILDVRV